jgi:hypothetical protein
MVDALELEVAYEESWDLIFRLFARLYSLRLERSIAAMEQVRVAAALTFD